MGRKKINHKDKKVRMSITVNPIIEKIIKEEHINLSSLTNDLLIKYFNGKEKKV
jgi:hypothetical protein